MNHDPFASWRAAMASLLATFATVELPYPKDEHRLRPPADSTLVARLAIEVGTTSSATALVGFYQHCDGADLPDIWNGYWLHPAELILRHRQEDPTSATIGFGSDGGAIPSRCGSPMAPSSCSGGGAQTSLSPLTSQHSWSGCAWTSMPSCTTPKAGSSSMAAANDLPSNLHTGHKHGGANPPNHARTSIRQY